MRILIGVDGSEPSKSAATLVGQIADPQRTEISVLSVAPLPDQPFPDLWVPETDDRGEQDAIDNVATAVERLKASGHDPERRVTKGHVQHEILDAIDRDGYDLVVLGAGSESWLGQHLLGSVSNHVLHTSAVSVMIVHRLLDHAGDKLKILVGSDGSLGARHAATEISRFADADRVRFDVISVAPYVMTSFVAVPGAATAVYDEAVQQEAADAARENALAAERFLRSQDYETSAAVARGGVAPCLLTEAESRESDLVVVGSRGLGALGRVFLGSTSDSVARHAAAALVVK